MFSIRKTTIVLSAALGLAAFSTVTSDALAGTATANLDVTAEISANCTISTAAVAFGAYDPIVAHKSADLAGTGTVTVTCTNGSAVKITLGQGANFDTGSTDAAPLRRMASGANHLSYSLFSDESKLNVWGNTVETGLADTGTGLASDLTVFGTIPANQNVPTGSYADTVIATVTF